VIKECNTSATMMMIPIKSTVGDSKTKDNRS
jgi:hypothetical protein